MGDEARSLVHPAAHCKPKVTKTEMANDMSSNRAPQKPLGAMRARRREERIEEESGRMGMRRGGNC